VILYITKIQAKALVEFQLELKWLFILECILKSAFVTNNLQ